MQTGTQGRPARPFLASITKLAIMTSRDGSVGRHARLPLYASIGDALPSCIGCAFPTFCRAMREWDEDGQPEAEAVEFGEFLMRVIAGSS